MIQIGEGLICGYTYKCDEQGVWIRFQRKGSGYHEWRKATALEENEIGNDPFYIDSIKKRDEYLKGYNK